MSQGLVTASYIVAAVLFIASLAGLSKQETAKYGNWFGITGMAIALIATIASPSVHGVIFILVAMVIGGAIGARLALKVEMTQMPELVAVLHSFVGLAAVLVGYNSFIELLPANAVQQLVLPLNGSPEEIMAAAPKYDQKWLDDYEPRLREALQGSGFDLERFVCPRSCLRCRADRPADKPERATRPSRNRPRLPASAVEGGFC